MKSWLAQGSSGRRVSLLPGTTFLHINGALESLPIRKSTLSRTRFKRGHAYNITPCMSPLVAFPINVARNELNRLLSS